MLIFKKKFWIIFMVSLITTFIFSIEVQAQPVLADFQGHWAEKPIQSLIEKGVINGYPDGTFKPDQAINRAEFAKLVAKTFNYTQTTQNSFTDVSGHWASHFINVVSAQKVMNAFSNGNFQPGRALSRAQVATMLSRILHLAKAEEKYGQWPADFSDVPADHWAFRYIEMAKKLELLPNSYQNQFYPDQAVTRAEAAWMIQALSRISVNKGKIASIDTDTGLINIQGQEKNEPLLSMIVAETIVLRNNTPGSIDTLLTGDEATVIALPSGDAKFVKAYGEVTKDDLLSRVSSMTKGKLTPDQISAVVAGDWESLKSDVQGGLYDKMVGMGLTPAEAESIMVQDWNYLDTLSKERLAQGISKYLGITQDLSQALLERDTEKIKEYGKIELATAALSRMLGATQPQQSQEDTY